jgi:hypothetical protein
MTKEQRRDKESSAVRHRKKVLPSNIVREKIIRYAATAIVAQRV